MGPWYVPVRISQTSRGRQDMFINFFTLSDIALIHPEMYRRGGHDHWSRLYWSTTRWNPSLASPLCTRASDNNLCILNQKLTSHPFVLRRNFYRITSKTKCQLGLDGRSCAVDMGWRESAKGIGLSGGDLGNAIINLSDVSIALILWWQYWFHNGDRLQ